MFRRMLYDVLANVYGAAPSTADDDDDDDPNHGPKLTVWCVYICRAQRSAAQAAQHKHKHIHIKTEAYSAAIYAEGPRQWMMAQSVLHQEETRSGSLWYRICYQTVVFLVMRGYALETRIIDWRIHAKLFGVCDVGVYRFMMLYVYIHIHICNIRWAAKKRTLHWHDGAGRGYSIYGLLL